MTDNATPKSRPNYSRPTKFPARLSTMLSQSARDTIDDLVEQRDTTLGDVARSIISDGLVLDAALAEPGLRADVERLARDAGVTVADAVGTMLDFAVRETRRRTERNARLAEGVARTFAEVTGIEPDGVSVGNVDLALDR